MTKKLLIILIIAVIGGYMTLNFVLWQTRIDLANQIQKVGDLLKQIDTLEKQIEELEKQTKEVTITTDKTEYEQRETIGTIVFNGLDFSIYADFWEGSWIILQHQDNEWKEIFNGRGKTLPMCLCERYPDGDCPLWTSPQEKFDEIAPSGTIDWNWNQKILQGTEKGCSIWIDVLPGKYKVEFKHFYTLDPNKREWKTVYSNEFTIKEREEVKEKEVTITSDKTEYSQGENVKINLSNGLKETIYYEYFGKDMFWNIQQYQQGEWKYIQTKILCPCGSLCDMVAMIMPLESDKTAQSVWDQKIRWCSDDLADETEYGKDAPSGRHRAMVYYALCQNEIVNLSKPIASYECESKESKTVYSEEFTIK